MSNFRKFDYTLTPVQQQVRDTLAAVKAKNVHHYENLIYRLYHDLQKTESIAAVSTVRTSQ